MTQTATSFPPVARNEFLDRLGALALRPAFDPEFWDNLHREIQGQLDSLETSVRETTPGTQVSAGRTSGEHFFLFSYRTFSVPGSALDPVVVGVTFTPTDQGVTLDADVSGEETGDCICSLPIKTVADSAEEMLTAARESARSLCQSASAITAALSDPSRTVD